MPYILSANTAVALSANTAVAPLATVAAVARGAASRCMPQLRRFAILAVAVAALSWAGTAAAADLNERLLQLNQREKQLIEKLEVVQQREREIQEKLDEVRVLKQSVLDKLAAQKPTGAAPTPAVTP